MPTMPVLDSTIYYEDSGTGTPIVFLHGNPSSSRMWRQVLPSVGTGRLLAPDLIGMGRSGKPDTGYGFADHARYLDAWFDALRLDRVVLVGHDWGGALAMDWSRRHPDRVLGIAFFESIIKPIAGTELSDQARARTMRIRTPGAGEDLVLEHDTFIRQAFTGGVQTPVDDHVLQEYLAPYPTPESRRPILSWARQLPVDGEPTEVVALIDAYDRWLATSTSVPKLLLTFEGSPTLLITPSSREWCETNITQLTVRHCGMAGHHAAEDRPSEIAEAISTWLDHHGLR